MCNATRCWLQVQFLFLLWWLHSPSLMVEISTSEDKTTTKIYNHLVVDSINPLLSLDKLNNQPIFAFQILKARLPGLTQHERMLGCCCKGFHSSTTTSPSHFRKKCGCFCLGQWLSAFPNKIWLFLFVKQRFFKVKPETVVLSSLLFIYSFSFQTGIAQYEKLLDETICLSFYTTGRVWENLISWSCWLSECH